jgi:hypothetical protein
MKGVIFNLLGDVVQREYRQGTWDAVLDAAELSRDDTSLGSCPDEEMARLAKVAAASTRLPKRSSCMHRGDDKCVVEISFTKHRG